MTQSTPPSDLTDRARYILHPTDFSANSDAAFAHALRLAISNKADLSLLHVGKDTDQEWDQFPSVREMLQRWGLIDQGAARSEVTELGIGIKKIIGEDRSVPDSIAHYYDRHPIDLIVLATAGRGGLAAWLKPSTAERVLGKLHIPTLFVPDESRGCVSPDSGEVVMDHVLVPVDHQPNSEAAVERGLRAIAMYGGDQADLTLLHVGSDSQFPKVRIPDGPWRINRVVRQGNPAAEILAAADECRANLIVMVTEGTHGFLDVLRGTTTEQVLREAPCPVLAVPDRE